MLRDSDIKVGAINCVKHRDLCRSLNVPSYPTLLALNSPGAPQGSAADPATKILEKKKNSFANVMDVIKAEFSGALDGAAVADAEMALARGLKEGKHVLDKIIEDVGGVAPCILRMEDAAVSVRFVLRSEVFVGGETLSEDRMGECTCRGRPLTDKRIRQVSLFFRAVQTKHFFNPRSHVLPLDST